MLTVKVKNPLSNYGDAQTIHDAKDIVVWARGEHIIVALFAAAIKEIVYLMPSKCKCMLCATH